MDNGHSDSNGKMGIAPIMVKYTKGLSRHNGHGNYNGKMGVVTTLSTSNRIPNRGQWQKGSHVYFLLQVFWVILLFDINVVLVLPW